MQRSSRQRRRPLFIAGTVAAGLLSIALSSKAGSAATVPPVMPNVGAVTDLTWGISPAEMDRTVSVLVDTGVRSVRLNANWSSVERTGKASMDAWALETLDTAVTKARNAGLEVLMPISDGVPYWASGDPKKSGGTWEKTWRPTNMSDYGDFVRFIVGRYSPLGVSSYEMWNEPNHPRFWPSGVNAAEYTEMLRAGSAAVRQANPNAKVLLGGLSSNDHTYLAALYAAGAGPLFDIAAIHPYTGSVDPDLCWTDATGKKAKDAFCGIEAVRDLMVANGDTAKPIWLTEFGWSTASATYGVTEAQQASFLTSAYTWLSSRPYVTNTFWYQLRNVYWLNDASSDLEANYGVLRVDYSPKPAAAALKSVAANQAPRTDDTTTTSSSTAPTTTATTVAPATTTTTVAPTPTKRKPHR